MDPRSGSRRSSTSSSSGDEEKKKKAAAAAAAKKHGKMAPPPPKRHQPDPIPAHQSHTILGSPGNQRPPAGMAPTRQSPPPPAQPPSTPNPHKRTISKTDITPPGQQGRRSSSSSSSSKEPSLPPIGESHGKDGNSPDSLSSRMSRMSVRDGHPTSEPALPPQRPPSRSSPNQRSDEYPFSDIPSEDYHRLAAAAVQQRGRAEGPTAQQGHRSKSRSKGPSSDEFPFSDIPSDDYRRLVADADRRGPAEGPTGQRGRSASKTRATPEKPSENYLSSTPPEMRDMADNAANPRQGPAHPTAGPASRSKSRSPSGGPGKPASISGTAHASSSRNVPPTKGAPGGTGGPPPSAPTGPSSFAMIRITAGWKIVDKKHQTDGNLRTLKKLQDAFLGGNGWELSPTGRDTLAAFSFDGQARLFINEQGLLHTEEMAALHVAINAPHSKVDGAVINRKVCDGEYAGHRCKLLFAGRPVHLNEKSSEAATKRYQKAGKEPPVVSGVISVLPFTPALPLTPIFYVG